MKALVLNSDLAAEIQERPMPSIGPGQLLVEVEYVGLNRRDQWIREGKYPDIKADTVLGSDACGKVVEIGSGSSSALLGKHVVINPNENWGDSQQVQSSGYSVLGMPHDGVFAEYVAIDQEKVLEKPSHLSAMEAASLPLGALTAYRTVFYHGQIDPSKRVLISGFGGGVAQFAFLFSQAVGAKVYITSGNVSNMQKAIAAGAAGAFNYKDPHWFDEAKVASRGFDVIVDSAGGDAFNKLTKMLNPGGKLIFYGATNGLPSKLDLYSLFWRQCTIQGTTMGSDAEFAAMIDFVEKNSIKPMIGVKDTFENILTVLEGFNANGRFGKSVIQVRA